MKKIGIEKHPSDPETERLISGEAVAAFEQVHDGDVIRNVSIDGTLWFIVSDICDALQLVDAKSTIRKLGDDEKGKVRLLTPGGTQEVNVVNEGGLYLLAFTSKKPAAYAFRRWVTNDVLPSLRKGAAGESQSIEPGKAYVRLPGIGRFRVTLETNGHLSIDELHDESYVADYQSPDVDALALAACLVEAVWRKYELLESISAFNGERSETRFQLGSAIKQAHRIATGAMRAKTELTDGHDATLQ